MKATTEGVLLRIFLGEADEHEGRPLYQVVVERAKALGIAGATVLRGLYGYGTHSHIHSPRILRLTDDLPVVVEIVDCRERLEPLLGELDGLVGEGLVTLEKVQVLTYRRGGA